ncbi:E3 ubiquitin- ligase RNF4 [Paramuricea clavata]|uniref:E3 ubiquitin- ligase RNF4 n=1 Tax=Paramuricea clavata TaxID=317549 RepID=A0A7D9DCT8_PARCT|nr:E3 ubiquitin- ligase RNF4 [Paramuricea clavata]
MNSQNESTEIVDLNQSQASQNVVGNGNRKTRTTKAHSRAKRVNISRKRNREGQLANVGTSELASHNGSIEVIDVEQVVKDKPVVDLTDESRNDVYVDLTSSPDVQLPHRQSVIRWQLSPGRTNTSELNKNADDIVIVANGSERVVNVSSELSQPLIENIMTCAICMDDFNQIKKAKRQLTSTTCGHVFCNPCITSSLHAQAKCPTCRKRLTKKSLHPIFL